jgi:hypothetical protein
LRDIGYDPPMSRARVLVGAAALSLAACDSGPPETIRGASGLLDDHDVYCAIYPSDGYASIQIGSDGYMEVTIPGTPDVWGRGAAVLARGDIGCEYDLGASGARVQWDSDVVSDPDCDQCSSWYHALYVEGLAFPPTRSCNCFDECIEFGGTHADLYYVWCDSPDEVDP